MPRGIPELKHRNARGRDYYHRRQMWQAAAKIIAASNVSRVMREDLQTGEITESSRSKMEREVKWYCTFKTSLKLNGYGTEQSALWEMLKNGASLFTETAKFWIAKPQG